MDHKKIDRINQLAKLAKERELTAEEQAERTALREEYIGNEEFMRRFRNESKAVDLLSHPNIVRVYDVSLSDRQPCIVMEYINGITLKDYIEQMRENVAAHLKVDLDCVNVKATTTEKLGFEGEGLGISTHAVACILKK